MKVKAHIRNGKKVRAHERKGKSAKSSSKNGKEYDAKMEKVMHEFKTKQLHSGNDSGPKVENRKQALAIAINEAKKAKKKKK